METDDFSNLFSDRNKDSKNGSVYTNINGSAYFSRMKYVPINPCDMAEFIYLHNDNIFFEYTDIAAARKFKNMSVLQLDTLFILLRHVSHFYKNLTNVVAIHIAEKINIFTEAPTELVNIFNKLNFFRDFSSCILKKNKYGTSMDDFIGIVGDYLEKIIRIHIKYNNDAKQNTQVAGSTLNEIREYLTLNIKKLEEFIKALYEIIYLEISKVLPNNTKILKLCSKNILEDNDKICLVMFIQEYIHLVPDYDNDVILKEYYEFIKDIRSREDDWENNSINAGDAMFNNYWYNNPNVFQHNNSTSKIFQHNLENETKSINEKLLKIRYQLADDKIQFWTHSIANCFVEKGLEKNTQEIARVVCQTMINEKDTVGYTNKYDDMTLFDNYVLVTMANDINLSYDSALEQLIQLSMIPFDYPIEILLRILSRIYCVDIIFYSSNLVPLFINNSLGEQNIIAIYQYNLDSFYNIISIDQQPLDHFYNTQTNTSIQQSSNNINDIVEI